MGLTPVGCDAFMKGPQMLPFSHCAPNCHPSSDTEKRIVKSSWADKRMNVTFCLPFFKASPISLFFLSLAPTQVPKTGDTASRELLNWLTSNMGNGLALRPEPRTHPLLPTSQAHPHDLTCFHPQAETSSLGQNKPGLISRVLLSIRSQTTRAQGFSLISVSCAA